MMQIETFNRGCLIILFNLKWVKKCTLFPLKSSLLPSAGGLLDAQNYPLFLFLFIHPHLYDIFINWWLLHKSCPLCCVPLLLCAQQLSPRETSHSWIWRAELVPAPRAPSRTSHPVTLLDTICVWRALQRAKCSDGMGWSGPPSCNSLSKRRASPRHSALTVK